jgi:hypothetical protein
VGIGDWLEDAVFSAGNAMRSVERVINPFYEDIRHEKDKDGNWKPVHDASKDGLLAPAMKPVTNSLEQVMHGMNWIYDNAISQPISTFFLVSPRNDDDAGEAWSDVFKGSTWAQAWRTAEHVSPGQAMFATGKEADQILENELVYAQPAASYLPPEWKGMAPDEQQEWLKSKGMPAVGNRAVEQMRQDHAWFTFASGAGDFAFRWYLDPFVLGGKGVGAARNKFIVKERPKGGWGKDDIESIMADSTMGKAQDFLWANKDNPALINNLSMFRKSALGPRAGGIVSTLKSREEVDLFLRVGLGDVEARVLLEQRNALAAQRLQQDTSRLSNLELNLGRFERKGQERYAAMVQGRIDEVTAQVNANEELVARYEGMLAHYQELDAVNLTRFSFDRAQRRTDAQAMHRTGPALGTAGSPRSRLGKARIYSKDFFGPNLVVVRSFKEAHPNGLIAVDDIHQEAVDELRAQIARIPGIGSDVRQSMLNDYLKTTTEGERLAHLEKIQGMGVNKVAEKHGFTRDEAMELYREYQGKIMGGQDRLRRYSAGAFPGEKVHLDEFLDHGGNLSVHPNLVTRLVNDHVMVDLKALDTTLARHGSALKALRTASIGNSDWIVNSADYLNHLWKFGTLFRLGYIPRVLGDDLAGQVARLGAATMAMRAGYGVKNLATNLARWKPASYYEAQQAAAKEGLKYVDDELKILQPKVDLARVKVETRELIHTDALRRARDRHRRATNKLNALGDDATPTQLRAHQMLVEKHAGEVARAEERLRKRLEGPKARLGEMDEHLADLAGQRAAALAEIEGLKTAATRGHRQSSQTYKETEVAPGVVVPAAFAGNRGEYYQKMISSDDSLRTILSRNKQIVHSNLQRAYGKQGVAISYPQDPKKFVSSWDQAINLQIMQDDFARLAVQGKSIEEMTHWLTRTPQGRAYHKRLGIKHSPPDRIAASVWHEVEEYLPTPEIRMAALEGKADEAFLSEAAKLGHHPMNVHTTQLGEALAGMNAHSQGLDRVMDWWYKTAASIPADRMSRHPLFNQLYEGHAKILASQEIKQGAKVSQKDADRIAETARRLALKDTRKLVFDIAHRSDAAHALRFISPFFAATTEAWQRWARIIADRPQTVGYAGVIFNAPISAGWMQDQDGNKVLRDGTVIDPITGNKTFVPKSKRLIMARVPRFVVDGPVGKAFNMDGSGRWLVSQDSMNMITQGDPWFNPGTGPIVAIPANEFVKDKPSMGELARHLGVLPHGPTAGSPLFGNTPLGRAADLTMPQTVKNFLTAYDTSDERYQRTKLQIMQRAAYEHANLGKPMPSAREIADMTKQYWLQSAAWAFVQPAATQRSDKYAFYRDQYNNLRRKDPMTADQEFLDRFGESYFIFAQATSKNKVGAEATKQAVELSKQYEELLAKNPELGALIIGPEGNGPFSPEAYTYQLTHPLVPGGSEMQRTKLSAEEAMLENQRRLGWAKYTQLQNYIKSKMESAGFQHFDDPGAEQFKRMRSAVAELMSTPVLPGDVENEYYNEEWAKDFYSFDPKKYERLIPALTEVAHSDMAKDPNRSDLRSLQLYLAGRQVVVKELERRYRERSAALKARGLKGMAAKSLTAKKNWDLRDNWVRFVDDLTEQDTRFGDLHSRYLHRDLSVDVDDLADRLDDALDEEAD